MLEKNFTPHTLETAIYQNWMNKNCFKALNDKTKPAFTIMMPPPNVTGVLHLGHALNGTIQDVLVRFKRQMGFDVLWQPGTDHAGIATQIVVEKQLQKEGLSRHDLGREKFLERVWQWKETSGSQIVHQMKRLGVSPDWSRERFTMDQGLSDAVKDIFVSLYNDGLIYKDKRLVNWDPILQSAISDLEVTTVETKGKLYHISYPIHDSDEAIIIATTRPETLFGDTAVAVHPDDERYSHLIGKFIKQPLTDRLIPIIADEYVDKDFGTGGLKVTPAHDFNDFNLGKKHNLPMINILNPDGSLNDNVPPLFVGLKGDDARQATLTALEEAGVLKDTTPNNHAVPISTRTEAKVEPYLTDQWFMATDMLAERALKAVEDKSTQFFPEKWQNTYFEWLNNIQPWCISRQLWWGHQIPAWYTEDGKIFVATTQKQAQEKADAYFGHHVTLTQDEDVLDTWFSSGLWPFSTLGWPEKTPELEKYYPTSVLVTGFDIIFFWVARMMMMGLYTQDKIPFEKVYIHALVQDEKGQKMSKSKGNIIDPLELMDEFGADALRFTLAILAVPGRDVKIGQSRVELYRNFITKIWSAARFLEMNEATYNPHFDPTTVQLKVSQWIISLTSTLSRQVCDALENFRFDLAAQFIYHFIWGIYCDYYLEFLKPILNGDDEAAKKEVKETAVWVFTETLKIFQPFMPFLAEHLWQNFTGKELVCQESWPVYSEKYSYPEACHTVDHLVGLINGIRTIRAEFRVPPASFIPLITTTSLLDDPIDNSVVTRLCRLSSIDFKASHTPTKGDILLMVEKHSYFICLGDSIDLEKEKLRLLKEIEKIQKDIASSDAKLNNDDFMKKAKENVIEEMKERKENFMIELKNKEEALTFIS